MPLKHLLRQAGGRCRMVIPFARARLADVGIAAVIVLPALGQAASTGGTPTMLYGTLDTEASTAATESAGGVGMAMFEFDWAAFEPEQGTFNSSYLASMETDLAAYQAAGMDITFGLGLQDPPAWVFKLADATYVDQKGDVSTEADFVFSAAVRGAADTYLAQIAASIPLSDFWAIRLTSGGDDEMVYPGTGTYWAFSSSALTGNGLPAGMTANPYPAWTPGTAGLTPEEIKQWVTWYVSGLDNVTDWQMQKLNETRLHRLLRDRHPWLGHPPRRACRPGGAEPARRHHWRRRRLERVLLQALVQEPGDRVRLLRRRRVRRQRHLPAVRRLAAAQLAGDGLLVGHPLDRPHR